MKRFIPALAGLLAVLYLTLAIAAVSCTSGPNASHRPHHQHGTTAHSPLCAWICHSNTEISPVSPSPVLAPRLLVVALMLILNTLTSGITPRRIHARSPPH